jgi:hypothetical protein
MFWVDALRAIEEGEKTRGEVMALTCISERTLERRLARAREVRDDFADDGPSETDLPWVEVVAVHPDDEPRTPHYNLVGDRLNAPAGAFRIGDGKGRLRVRHAGQGRPVDDTGHRKDYEPDPDGLAGGLEGKPSNRPKRKAKLPETAA